MKLRIAIDGACRRNGKPDCISAGGVYIRGWKIDKFDISTRFVSEYEFMSTNQRGEILALVAALSAILEYKAEDTQIITDSEYIYNAMTKEWPQRWAKENWHGSMGEKVKNADIWQHILHLYNSCIERDYEISFYHIKGHLLSIGKVTTAKSLAKDKTGDHLLGLFMDKFEENRRSILEASKDCFIKNHGFFVPSTIKVFVCMNMMADAIATQCVEAANSLWLSNNKS